MIVADTSALMAILLSEQGSEAVIQVFDEAHAVCISAGTLAEAIVVAEHRLVGSEMRHLIEGLGIEVASVTASGAERVAAGYRKWGKGIHPAGLNFGDCFAYALAMERGCPLVFVGDDFGQTDVKVAGVAGVRD